MSQREKSSDVGLDNLFCYMTNLGTPNAANFIMKKVSFPATMKHLALFNIDTTAKTAEGLSYGWTASDFVVYWKIDFTNGLFKADKLMTDDKRILSAVFASNTATIAGS